MGQTPSKTLQSLQYDEATIDPEPSLKIESTFKEFPLNEAPKDEEGFVKSFNIDQEAEYLAFFKRYGFVVVNNILNDQEINDSIEEVWDVLEKRPWGPDQTRSVKRNDPATWENDMWPNPRKLGILGADEACGPMAWKNRQNPNLYKVFSTVMNDKKLWASVDRWGMMRPTKGVSFPNGEESEVVDKPEWKSEKIWLHWDLNPWKWMTGEGNDYTFNSFISENNGSKNKGSLKLQGLICLTDSTEEDGGFCTVSGFHEHLKEWTEMTTGTDYHHRASRMMGFVNVPKDDPMTRQVQKISARAGSLIVWNSEQPHCNFPNNSSRFRINQYIKMFPAQEGGPNTKERTEMIKKMIPEGFEISPLGQSLFGLQSY